MIIFGFKMHDIFLNHENFDFVLKYIGKMGGAGAEILTSCSRSRTKIGRLRNTVLNKIPIIETNSGA
jgi:hypothetical protein